MRAQSRQKMPRHDSQRTTPSKMRQDKCWPMFCDLPQVGGHMSNCQYSGASHVCQHASQLVHFYLNCSNVDSCSRWVGCSDGTRSGAACRTRRLDSAAPVRDRTSDSAPDGGPPLPRLCSPTFSALRVATCATNKSKVRTMIHFRHSPIIFLFFP